MNQHSRKCSLKACIHVWSWQEGKGYRAMAVNDANEIRPLEEVIGESHPTYWGDPWDADKAYVEAEKIVAEINIHLNRSS